MSNEKDVSLEGSRSPSYYLSFFKKRWASLIVGFLLVIIDVFCYACLWLIWGETLFLIVFFGTLLAGLAFAYWNRIEMTNQEFKLLRRFHLITDSMGMACFIWFSLFSYLIGIFCVFLGIFFILL